MYVRSTYGGKIITYHSNLSTFLSSIETLHDPLYFIYNNSGSSSRNITIDSPLFEAPNGIYDIMQSVTFTGSTFEKGPRIYSDTAMKSAITWPYIKNLPIAPSVTNDWINIIPNSWKPFANCQNMTSIENQGSLGSALKYVFPCELHINNPDQPCDLSAYPSMEEATPTHIVNYIAGDIVNISSLNNTLINTTKVEYLYYPFSFNKYVLDTVSESNLPLGGIDIAGKTMKNCSLDLMNLDFSGGFKDAEYNDFTISYAHFGVFAPEYTEVCENLHSYYMNIPDEIEYNVKEKEDWIAWKTSQKNHLLTPQTIKNHCNESWGEALIEHWEPEWIDEVNQIPSYPQGVKRLMGYMDKYFVENSFITWEEEPDDDESTVDDPYTIEENPTNPNVFAGVKYGMKGDEEGFFNDFSSVQRVMHKDNFPFLFVPRRISLVDDRAQVTNLYRNLYANLVIDQPITVPSLPSVTQYANFCYTGMFANSTGLEMNEYERIAKKTTPITFYTRGYAHSSSTISGGSFPVYMLNDPTYSDGFWSKFNDQNSEFGWAVAQGHIDEDYIDYTQNLKRIVPWSGWNDTIDGYEAYRGYDNEHFYWDFPLSEEINSKNDILNYIYDLSQMEVFMRTKRFNHSVTFEEQDLPKLKASAYCFNQLFYGSNPNINTGNIVSNIPDTGLNGRNYDEAFIFNYFESKLMRPVIITGYFEVDVERTIGGQEIVSETESYKYMIVLFYDNWDISELDPSFAVGEEIVNKMPATRNIYQGSYTGLKVKQMFSSVSRDLIEDFEDKETTVLQPLLTSKGIEMTTDEFFAPSSNNQRDSYAAKETFNIGIGYKASKLPGDVWPVKKPSAYTNILLLSTHAFISANIAVRTFSPAGYSGKYPRQYTYNYKEIPVGSTRLVPNAERL